MSSEHIQVEVTRTGGFAGMSRKGRVDTADVEEERAATLRRLVSEMSVATGAPRASAASGGGRDRFQYNVTIVSDDDRRSLVLHEPLSDADQRLVAWVLAEGRLTG